jgi:predicted MPP superfamily phosphohydrolase
MFDQRKKLPLSWRGLRIYFLADLHYFEPTTPDLEKGMCCVRKLEYDEKRRDWVRSLVDFEKNIWTRKDFFIIQV